MEKKWPFSRERLRQLRRNARALCSVARCDNPLFRGGRCKGHYAMDKARLKAAYANKKAKVVK